MSGVIQELVKAVEEGFLLHGSRFPLQVLEPRQGRCLVKRGGNQLGVYATSSVQVACTAAMLHPKGEHYQTIWRTADEDILQVYGRNVVLKEGYVYVAPASTFKVVCDDAGQQTNEFVSLVPVTPFKHVLVTPDLLSLLRVSVKLL